MSLLVRGMEMPKCCFDCCLQVSPMCIKDDIVDFTKRVRPDNCPLVEVPDKHDRLIEADEVVYALLIFKQLIESIPTMIEAEGRKE